MQGTDFGTVKKVKFSITEVEASITWKSIISIIYLHQIQKTVSTDLMKIQLFRNKGLKINLKFTHGQIIVFT